VLQLRQRATERRVEASRRDVLFGRDEVDVRIGLEDGSIMFVMREPQGAVALYRIVPGRPADRLGVLPYTQADYSVSSDGRHVAAFGYSDKNDIYMIRNFGKLLGQ
jgi:hypothetical protein